MSEETYYTVLGVPETATHTEIKQAYRDLVRQVHPDSVPTASLYWKQVADEKTKEVNEAYRVLSDSAQRSLYDRQLAEHRKATAPPQPAYTPPPQSPPKQQAARPPVTPTYQPVKSGLFRCNECGAYFHWTAVCPKTGVKPKPSGSAFSGVAAGYAVLILCGVCFFLLRYSVWIPLVSGVAVSAYQLYVTKKLTFKLSAITVALFVFAIWDVWSPDEPSTAPARTPTAVATAPMPTGVAAARAATGVAATPTLSLSDVVREASKRYRLDPDLLNSVIRVGSGFNPHAVSPKGAQGLMQLMPQTASKLGAPNAFDPAANVDAGTRYLRELLERYNFDLIKALAAYYAGPEIVDQYGGAPPDHETRAYVASIVRDYNRKKIAQQKAAKADAQERAKANKKPDTSGTVDKPSAELLNSERLPKQVPVPNPNSAAPPQHNPCVYTAVLRNGFVIRHQRRKVIGEETRFYLTDDRASFVDVPTADIDHLASDSPSDCTSTESDRR